MAAIVRRGPVISSADRVPIDALDGYDVVGGDTDAGSDVVAEDRMTPADRVAAGSYVGCISGALSRTEYLNGLRAAGFSDAEVTFSNEAVPGMHSAIIRAVKPALTLP